MPIILAAIIFAQTSPMPWPDRGGSPPHGYSRSGSFIVPRQGAQEAIPLPKNGSCPFQWTRSGDFCLRSGS